MASRVLPRFQLGCMAATTAMRSSAAAAACPGAASAVWPQASWTTAASPSSRPARRRKRLPWRGGRCCPFRVLRCLSFNVLSLRTYGAGDPPRSAGAPRRRTEVCVLRRRPVRESCGSGAGPVRTVSTTGCAGSPKLPFRAAPRSSCRAADGRRSAAGSAGCPRRCRGSSRRAPTSRAARPRRSRGAAELEAGERDVDRRAAGFRLGHRGVQRVRPAVVGHPGGLQREQPRGLVVGLELLQARSRGGLAPG